MIVLDVNILVSAFRQDHAHHAVAAPWFRDLFANETVVVPDLVWVGFLRIVTSARIFENPATLEQAFAFVGAVTGSDAYFPVAGLEHTLLGLEHIASESDARANLMNDAYIAAIAMSLACPVGTFDRDFRRFTGLRIVTPTSA